MRAVDIECNGHKKYMLRDMIRLFEYNRRQKYANTDYMLRKVEIMFFE